MFRNNKIVNINIKPLFYKAEQLVVVVIPVYKNTPDQSEVFSFSRVLKILSSHPIILIAPYSLNINWYKNFGESLGVKFRVECFDDNYFADINGYNRLMLSSSFYERFIQYKYILIYQLDCYVFRDELHFWCSQEYDYLGAPWPKKDWPYIQTVYAWLPKSLTWLYKKKIKKINLVGNGGFSLRKTKKFYFLSILLSQYINNWISIKGQEDVFWSFFATILYPFYKVGSEEIALRFAFERGVKYLYKMNNENLPFGCHAWQKYDTDFWLEKFKSSNDIIRM